MIKHVLGSVTFFYPVTLSWVSHTVTGTTPPTMCLGLCNFCPRVDWYYVIFLMNGPNKT